MAITDLSYAVLAQKVVNVNTHTHKSFAFHANVSVANNFHEMSNPIFWVKKQLM